MARSSPFAPTLAGVTALALLAAACAGGDAADSAEEAAEVDLAEIDEPVEIEFYYGLGGFLGEMVEGFVEEFNETQDDVVVSSVTQGDYDETAEAYQAAIAADDPPAAVVNAPIDFADRGVIAPLQPFLDADEEMDASDYVEAFMEAGEVEGELYFLPMYGTTQVMYYRHDFFEDEDIDPATAFETWENLGEAAEALTVGEEGDRERYGWEPMWGEDNMIDAVYSRGGSILNDDETEVLLTDDVWVDTLEQFREWLHDDEIMRIHHGGTGWEYWYNTIDDVLQDRAAGYTGSSGDQGDLDFDLVSAHPQPGWEGHDPAPVAEPNYASISADVSPEEQRAAYEWLKFFTEPENTAEFSIETGYIAVRESAQEEPEFQAHIEENPHAAVPLEQAEIGSPPFQDPTGGEILDALSIAVDEVQIENVPADEALASAQEEAQEALDRTEP